MRSAPVAVIVMGVCGSGKTTVSRELAARIGAQFEEGDAYHPEANVAKMSRGEPLNDDDRKPWLELIASKIQKHFQTGNSVVFACSALKEMYRTILAGGCDRVYFLHLAAKKEVIIERMRNRQGHFMPISLIESQFATLEPPVDSDHVLTVDVGENDVHDVVEKTMKWLRI